MPREKKKKLLLRREWCKGCNICVAFCPVKVLALDDESRVVLLDEERCTACGLCELRCPDFAIELVPDDEPASEGAAS